MHEADDLEPVQRCDPAYFRVGEPRLGPSGTLLEDAQSTGLRGLPVDPAVSLWVAGGGNALVEVGAECPIGAAAGPAPVEVPELALHLGEDVACLGCVPLAEAGRRGRVDLGVAEQVLKNEQVVEGEDDASLALFGHEGPERNGKLVGGERDLHCFALILDGGRLLPLDEHGGEHPGDSEGAAVDEAEASEGVDQVGVAGLRIVVEDVVGRDAADEAARIADLEMAGELLDEDGAGDAVIGVAEGVHQGFAEGDLGVGAILPPGDRRTLASVRRYAELLAMTWRLVEAQVICAQLPAGEKNAIAQDWLEMAVATLKGTRSIVEADLRLPVLIEAATIVDGFFVGIWAVDTAESIRFPMGGLTAQVLAAKYEEVRATDGREGLPRAEHDTFSWLSRKTIRQIDTVLFDTPCGTDGARARLAIKLLEDGLQNRLVPSLLLEARTVQGCSSPEEHNQRVMRVYDQVDEGEGVVLWIQEVYRLVHRALSRLHTEALSPWAGRVP